MSLNRNQLQRVQESLSPDMLIDQMLGSKEYPWSSPMEFFESDRFCGLRLYPGQRLMLKLWNLQLDDLTDWEKSTIDRWTKSFRNDQYTIGISSDVYERASLLKNDGYEHFTTTISILGRRASKSTLCGAQMALLDAEALWNGVDTLTSQTLDDIARQQDAEVGESFFQESEDGSDSVQKKDTSTYSIVMATTAQQAQETLFSNYYETVLGCRWLQQYILRITPFEIVYQTMNDKVRTMELLSAGVPLEREISSLRSRPVSSNSSAMRGRACIQMAFDEIFFSLGGDSARAGDRSIRAMRPAMQQFGRRRMQQFPSSPWTRDGLVYQMYVQGRQLLPEYERRMGMKREEAIDDVDRRGHAMVTDPSVFIAQLESWRLYEGYEDQSFRPTYVRGWSPKTIVVENEQGQRRTLQTSTNARVGDYVRLEV